jgi:digeranylgeranylglycerophospholipid reductase
LVDIFLGEDVAPGWFGWVIPVGQERVRVGTGASRMPKRVFRLLVERYPEVFEGIDIIQSTSGFVRLGLMHKTYGERALLVGDAACHVKPISGGGLYLGLVAAQICAAAAIDALRSGDFSEDFLACYQSAWEKKIGSEIHCGLHHREIFLGLSDQEMDSLITCLNNSYWRRLILKHGDLDYHSALAQKLTTAPPWARHFVVKGMKALLNYGAGSHV